jgi:ATP-dependent DNA helicase RecG
LKTSIEQLEVWLQGTETHGIEFKAARASFDSKKELPEYCAAIANSGGGVLVLGVDDDRNVVGTEAFKSSFHALAHEIYQTINHHIEVDELFHQEGRVLIFRIPARRIGVPVRFKGKYLMRRGSSSVDMDDQTLKSILNELDPDFSAQLVPGLTFADLDERALEELRKRWAERAGRPDFNSVPVRQVLADLELGDDDGITYAALILVGSQKSLSHHLANAEVIFEWRLDREQIHHDARRTWRSPYLLICDEIVQEVNARNYRFPLQEGMFQWDIFAFDEKSVREAVNNAVAHRDYRLQPSVFIKQSKEEFLITSPGGFPSGITVENILQMTLPRNRRIAEVMNRIGLVERAGQGLDDIFRKTISAGKGLPVIKADGDYWVYLSIPASVQDVGFLKFIEQIISQKQISFSIQELIALDGLRRGQKLDAGFKEKFVQYGLVERVGSTGRSVKYVLSHAYYAATNQRGEYTRQQGLARDEQIQLIIKHIKKNGRGVMSEFMQVLPQLSKPSIASILRNLRKSGVIDYHGKPKDGFWALKDTKSKV